MIESYEPYWQRIAREWQDPGRGASLAALASGAWVPPFDDHQRGELEWAAETISDERERLIFLSWLRRVEVSASVVVTDE